jgi:hypothetical protein
MSLTMDSPSSTTKHQRVLACVRCQQRKVKCDRKYPCSNCTKSRKQCEQPAPVLHRRKKRFPERELLDRIRSYEDLLSQNRIKFEPLHKDSTVRESRQSPHREESHDPDDKHPRSVKTDHSSPLTTANYTQRVYGDKYVFSRRLKLHEANCIRNFWHAMNKRVQSCLMVVSIVPSNNKISYKAPPVTATPRMTNCGRML